LQLGQQLGATLAPCLPVFPKLESFAANPRPPFAYFKN